MYVPLPFVSVETELMNRDNTNPFVQLPDNYPQRTRNEMGLSAWEVEKYVEYNGAEKTRISELNEKDDSISGRFPQYAYC